MEIISPLDLPEIRHMLIKFLRPREFTHLVLVCKAWYESFAPALWTSVIPPKAFNSKLDRFLDGLNRNRLLVRILEFERDIPPLYRSIHLPSLETLHILFNPPTREEGHIITNFLWRHSTVRHLKLKWLTQNGDPSVRWTLLKGFRNLSTLTIHGAMFEECRDPDAMRDLLLNLNTLHLSRIQLPHYSKPSNGFPKMKNLTLQNMRDTPPMEQLQFILLCSNLKRLGWSGTEPYLSNDPKRTYPIVQFAKALEANTWSELEYLEWFSHRDSNWELQCVIGAIPRLVGFTMDQISEQDLTALSLHFGWIKELNLDRVEIMDNGVLAEALRSCPQLESFRALVMPIDVFVDSEPWPCERSLKIFHVALDAQRTRMKRDTVQEMFIKRLSRLHRLEELRLSFREYNQWRLGFNLDQGLEQLSTLTRLKKIFIDHGVYIRSVREVGWMVKHWKSLITLLDASGDIGDYTTLRRKLQLRGIEYVTV